MRAKRNLLAQRLWRWHGRSATGNAQVTAMLPLGTHTVILIADDGKGGADSDTVEITVNDDPSGACSDFDKDRLIG